MQATTIEWHTSGGNACQWAMSSPVAWARDHRRTWARPGLHHHVDLSRAHSRPPRQASAVHRVLLEISSQMRSYAASVLYELGARYLTSPGRLDHARGRDLVGIGLDGPKRHHDRRLPHPPPRHHQEGPRRVGHAVRRLSAGRWSNTSVDARLKSLQLACCRSLKQAYRACGTQQQYATATSRGHNNHGI